MLVSPTDRELLSLLGGKAISSYLPERYGADVLAVVEGRGKLAIQRKTFPDDLLASLEDGRLTRELPLLAQVEYPVLIVEGRPMWTADGHLMQSWSSRWTRAQLRNLLRSVWRVHGVAVEQTTDINDTAAAILEMEAWFRKDTHLSLLHRPKNTAKDTWGLADKRSMARYFLQGLPGVGPSLAEAIFDTFGKIPLRWSCTQKELMSVYGIGPKRAKALWEALE
jgi:ERCC4-type nuclease